MPDIKFDTLDAIPEGLREAAKQVDGKFIVNVVLKTSLDEFRDNNIKFLRERDEALAKVTSLTEIVGADPAALRAELAELREISQKVKDGKLTTTDAIKTATDARVQAIKEELDKQIKGHADRASAGEAKAAELEQKLHRSVIDRGITEAVIGAESGANPSAIADILERAYRVFKVNSAGSLVPMQGEAVIYGSDGAKPMSPKEWLAKLLVEAPHFAKSSVGGGAGGSGGGAKIGGYSQEAFDKLPPEERMRIYRAANKKT